MSMKFKLEIDCGNAAFDDGNLGNEIARILRAVAVDMVNGVTGTHNVRDDNGNKCGSYNLYKGRAS